MRVGPKFFEKNGTLVTMLTALCVAGVIIAMMLIQDPKIIFASHVGPGAFYKVIPWGVMTAFAGATFLFAILSLVMSFRNFWSASQRPAGDTGAWLPLPATRFPFFQEAERIVRRAERGVELARRDQIREDWQQHRDEARDDWQNWFDDHYGWYGDWYGVWTYCRRSSRTSSASSKKTINGVWTCKHLMR